MAQDVTRGMGVSSLNGRIGFLVSGALVAAAGMLVASGPTGQTLENEDGRGGSPGTSGPSASVVRASDQDGVSAVLPAARTSQEMLIHLSEVRRLHVTSLGRIVEDRVVPLDQQTGQQEGQQEGEGHPPGPGGGPGGGSLGPGCQQVSTHTDANFTGGSFRLQAGMGEGEAFAATYSVPAGQFPIKLDLAEVIFGTSGATVPTTTQWSFSVWSGNPQTGQLIDEVVADDVILPYVRLGVGTNGTLLQFSVDPNDPDQIIIPAPADGSNTFTISFKIVNHNNQTSNPCVVAPPSQSNAFMATDVSGLAQPANNWLLGLNCGPFGCPANGGWSRFSNLASFCRPTGDWVARATWSPVTCVDAGACCLPNGTCQILSSSDCQTQGGTYRGSGTECATANCPTPTGACCFSNGFCIVLTEANCVGSQGTWLGANTQCGANNTCPTGACCLPTGSCVSGVTQAQCQAQGGAFRGVGTNCSTPCPQPTGACCLSNGFCLVLTEADCQGIPGSTWGGALTTCADGNGNGQADICEPECRADFNADGQVDFFDYLDFSQAFATDDASADFNRDAQVDFFDYLDFSQAYAEGCD
ncbi:MAG: hypothetical protein SFZ23_01635 [Planctomycetota bacterium]|nr:hypothetical protein [Planctomycetota bacterium]